MSRSHSLRLLVVVCCLPLAAGLVGLGRSPVAEAATCVPTGVGQLTAVLVNPTQPVTGTIDATNCAVGVYVGPGHRATLQGADISNAKVAAVADDGSLSISQSHLHLGRGVGLLLSVSVSGASATITHTTFDDALGPGDVGILALQGMSSLTASQNIINLTGSLGGPNPSEGISLNNVSRATLTNNTISNAVQGIVVEGTGTYVATNNILQNDSDALSFSGTTAALINHNQLSYIPATGDIGVFDIFSSGDVITNNAICGYIDPIETSRDTNPIVKNNTVKATC